MSKTRQQADPTVTPAPVVAAAPPAQPAGPEAAPSPAAETVYKVWCDCPLFQAVLDVPAADPEAAKRRVLDAVAAGMRVEG